MSRLSILTLLLLLFVSVVDALAQNEKDCPKISVIEPAGIVQPREPFSFTGVVEGKVSENVTYHWTVSSGKIAEGQGTLKISIDADWSSAGTTITATLNVGGLPEICPNSASGTAGITIYLIPVLIDEFGRLANAAVKTKLEKFFTELNNNPNNQGYIINYGTEKEMNSRERLIVDGITFRNYDRSRITIVRGGVHMAGTIYTKLYRVPPGADNPAP